MKTVAIIQARMGSTRLPGKVLKKVLDKPLLSFQLERVKRTTRIDDIVVATTNEKIDDGIVHFCKSQKVHVFRGAEEDVLSRYYEAAVKHKADIIVRLTSDCPLIEPAIIDQVIQLYLDKQPIDYVSNTYNKRTFPRGLDTEVFSFQALKKAHQGAVLQRDREHVTAYIYSNKNSFQLAAFSQANDYSHHRWTVDTDEDFELVSRILKTIYPTNPTFTMENVIQLLKENPSWVHINAHIEQKKL